MVPLALAPADIVPKVAFGKLIGIGHQHGQVIGGPFLPYDSKVNLILLKKIL
jgi:hypothetical protein